MEIHAARVGYRRAYGVRKTWKELRRRGVEDGRDHVARLMREEGLEGFRRGKKRRTTIPDEAAVERARDLLQRDFNATRPNEKWVADITYIRTWNGFVYLAFILDCYSRMIVGWQLASHMRTDLVIDALEMANGLRRPDGDLIAHTDRGSQYTSLATPTASTNSVPHPRSVRKATPTTTRWPKPGSRPSVRAVETFRPRPMLVSAEIGHLGGALGAKSPPFSATASWTDAGWTSIVLDSWTVT